jgi:hypothetical protein
LWLNAIGGSGCNNCEKDDQQNNSTDNPTGGYAIRIAIRIDSSRLSHDYLLFDWTTPIHLAFDGQQVLMSARNEPQVLLFSDTPSHESSASITNFQNSCVGFLISRRDSDAIAECKTLPKV